MEYTGTGTASRVFYVADERGSVIAGTDGVSGARTFTNKYDEYGRPAGGNQGRFQYTGQVYLESTGLYHYKAGVYDPSAGRFLQADPIGYLAGMNLYAYVGADPINRRDPLGLDDDLNDPPRGRPPPPDRWRDIVWLYVSGSSGRSDAPLLLESTPPIGIESSSDSGGTVGPMGDVSGLTSSEARIVFEQVFSRTSYRGRRAVELIPSGPIDNIYIVSAEEILEEVVKADDRRDRFGQALEEAATFGIGRFMRAGRVRWEIHTARQELDNATLREDFLREYLMTVHQDILDTAAANFKPRLIALLEGLQHAKPCTISQRADWLLRLCCSVRSWFP